MIRSILFYLIFILLEVRNISGIQLSTYTERKLFREYSDGWGYLQFKSGNKMTANPEKACVTAYESSRNYERSSSNRAFGSKKITLKQVKRAEFNSRFYLESPKIMVEILKCVFPNEDTFALTAGGFMISVTHSDLMEHIPALADKRFTDCVDEVKKKCLSSPKYEHCNARNLGGDELDEEYLLFHTYIKELKHLQFSSDSKVTANLSKACCIAYENSRQYVTFSSEGELSIDKHFTMQSVSAEIDHEFPLKGKVSSVVVKCKFQNGDNFAITPGGFMVSVINFKVMEHIPELADEKCLDLMYQCLLMKSPEYMTGKATLAEELALFHNYCTGERLQFEKGSKVTANLPEACVTAYNTSRSYGSSSGKQTSSNKDVTVKDVKGTAIDDLFLVRGPTKNVMSEVVQCLFNKGDKFAIAPGGFLVNLNDLKIVEHVPTLADKNCLNLIKEMKIYGVK